jgi:hypothetical protein
MMMRGEEIDSREKKDDGAQFSSRIPISNGYHSETVGTAEGACAHQSRRRQGRRAENEQEEKERKRKKKKALRFHPRHAPTQQGSKR